ncbi:MAG: IreB family regulatory phosphoprotein [Lachnospiraceae bacterium]|nr:IreB family regulatory phosphoprotein [Lachnospiraceae bacterium]
MLRNQNNNNTQFFNVSNDQDMIVRKTIDDVYQALTEKGYNPVSQIVGYIMSGDPTYITSHNGARSLIMKVERDEIIEELLKDYIETNLK